MALKLDIWDNPEKQKQELQRRLRNAMESRQTVEKGWREAERIIYTLQNVDETGAEKIALGDGTGVDDAFTAQPNATVNTTFKNYRFLHSQMSANPPTVVCRPTSSDLKDVRAADAADRISRFAIRKYKLMEHVDRLTGHALLYGSGFIKHLWDAEEGEVLDFNPETNEILCEGDIDVSVPNPWDIYIDPDARTWDKVRYVFERQYMPYEEACRMFPTKQEVLDKIRQKTKSKADISPMEQTAPSFLKQQHFDVVEVYQYWESGLHSNGMQGRYCYCTSEGDPLSDILPSPHRFAPSKSKLDDGMDKTKFQVARLPYSMLTDIDNPTGVWGRSAVLYAAPLQDIHNALINTMVENARAHGVARLIMHEDTTVADDSITNSPYDIVRWTGTRPPEYQAPMQLPTVINDLIGLMANGIDSMYGVNENMFGQQSREQSGFSMQYATNQGNMIRRRLFNKYTDVVESLFRNFLDLVIKHWEVERTVSVIGKEKAFESIDLKGSDISGGYDLVVEYGAALSLDPVSRRQELITMMPLFEKAGVDPRELLRLVKLSELESGYDMVQQSADRQQEIFDTIISTGQPVEPKQNQDHVNMLKYCSGYVMGASYRDLAPEVQQLIDQHIQARQGLSTAASAAGAPGAPAPAGGPAPVPELPQGPGTMGASQETQVSQIPAGPETPMANPQVK